MIIFPSFGWRVDLMALQHCRQFLFIMGDGQRCVKTKRQIVGRIFNYISWTDDLKDEWMNGRNETGRGAGSKRIIFQSQTTTGQKLIACWCRQNYRDSANVLNPRHRRDLEQRNWKEQLCWVGETILRLMMRCLTLL